MSEPFNDREQRAWDLIVDAMCAIQDLDERRALPVNQEELSKAVHTLQGFVTQHMNWRHWPATFGDWWAP